ncbi:MAG: hypothetical protein WC023_08240 [Rhodocyclaceae bacterium]
MANSLKNSKTDIVFGALAAAALLERAIRGIFIAEASSFVRGNGTPRFFFGRSCHFDGASLPWIVVCLYRLLVTI